MKTGVMILMAIGLLLSSSAARPVPDGKKDLRDAKAALEKAAYASDRPAILQAREKFRALAADSSVARWALYYSALASWQLHAFAVPPDRATMGRDLQDCVASLRKAIELDSKFAEGYILLHRCLGEQIKLDPRTLGRTLGPESSQSLESALKLDPANPRVAILKAMATFYVPEAYGGSQKRGLAEWQHALAAFSKKKPTDPLTPTWGLAEGWAWLGQAYMQAKPAQPDRAREAYRKALAARPDFRWVTEVGLPSATQP